jgi:NADPH:quinone reductase-like Zn-dependent oxidoreductase
VKAFYLTSYGGPEASKFGVLPDTEAGTGQLLIQVKAVSINPVDNKIKHGDLKMIVGSKFPKIIGSDFAGIVKQTSQGADKFKPGDRVYGAISAFSGKPGSLSELISIDPKYVRPIPDGMSFEEAASLPIASLTALNGLKKCKVSSGTHLLINGATGGVGHFAIQIAKSKGAIVTASCSQTNAELAKKLGADKTIEYSKSDLLKTENKFDAILDAYGKMEYEVIRHLLKRNGIYATTLFFPKSFFSSIYIQIVFGKKLTSSNMRARPEDYDTIEKLFSQKKLIPLIENRFDLEKSEDAFEMAEKGKPRGKIIIKV